MSQLDASIKEQFNRVFHHQSNWELIKPCLINSGIIRLDEEMKSKCISIFVQAEFPIKFFIPASGSGSRMFAFLNAFEEDQKLMENKMVVQFFDAIEKFAFWDALPIAKKNELLIEKKYQSFLDYILNEEGLNYKNIPKGLIPFHRYTSRVLNPFQEQVLQAQSLLAHRIAIHFTIQDAYREDIIKSINKVLTEGTETHIEYSEQATDSDVTAFNFSGNPIIDARGNVLKMPAGHGALLRNLNALNDDIILVKNIDNVVRQNNINDSIEMWRQLVGLMLLIRSEAEQIWTTPSLDALRLFNSKYQLLNNDEFDLIEDAEVIRQLLNRPFRICGMVKNQGEPGGGPFWVKKNGRVSKQIVEKSQIPSDPINEALLSQSTHFNPVIMVVSNKDFNGKKFNLELFADQSSYLIVEKNFKGQEIKFAELPGLWNGGMANWNSVFVEVPNTVFSPVKSLIDLLRHDHSGN
jgi:hypothetical protein